MCGTDAGMNVASIWDIYVYFNAVTGQLMGGDHYVNGCIAGEHIRVGWLCLLLAVRYISLVWSQRT